LPGGIRPPPPAIFDVDGFIYDIAPTFINVSDIDRVAVLTRNGAVSRYGPRGAGGVIIINTKEQTRIDDRGVPRVYDNAALADSLATLASQQIPYSPEVSSYMHDFGAFKTEKEALEHYEKQKTMYKEMPTFFFDVSEYFLKKWDNREKTAELLQFVSSTYANDVTVLKALAYRYETLNQPENALKIYLQLLKLRSKAAQSHRDVANAYAATGNYNKALQYYARYETAVTSLDTIPYDKYGADFLMTLESNTLVQQNTDNWDIENIALNDSLEYPTTRLVFEWSRPDAEIELQVVSPDEYFDTWKTPASDSIEKQKGYESKQFFLDDDFKGEWQINGTYLSNKTNEPSFLKVTVFFDYGKNTQNSYVLLFKLSERNIKQVLLTIDTETKSVSG
ncbi:MAG: hypothetical protein WBM83_00185, partial [Flavobacteriaceae bacterium]